MTTATAHRPRRPASARGGRGNSARVAYDLGRRGEAAPAWIGDNDSWVDAYERGVSDRDAAEAGTTRTRDEDTSADDVSTSSAGSAGSDSPAVDGDSDGARDGTVSDDSPPASRRTTANAMRSDARNAGGWLSGRVDVDDASGLIWGLLAAGMFLAAIDADNPVDGLKAWFRAKFFNITPATGAGASSKSTTPASISATPTTSPQIPAPATTSASALPVPRPAPGPAPKPPAPKGSGV